MSIYSPVSSAKDRPDLAQALGDVILAWTDAEGAQVGLFAALLGATYATASRLYQKLPNYRSRTQALLALIETKPEFEATKPFVLKLSALSKKRNNFVHGFYIQEWGTTELRLIDQDEASGSPKRSHPTKPNDIHQHAEAVRNCVQKFHAEGETCKAYAAWLKPHISRPMTLQDLQSS